MTQKARAEIMSKEFWRAAGIRAVKTVCQTTVALIGTTTLISSVDWKTVVSASIMSGVVSLLTSISTGLPEVKGE